MRPIYGRYFLKELFIDIIIYLVVLAWSLCSFGEQDESLFFIPLMPKSIPNGHRAKRASGAMLDMVARNCGNAMNPMASGTAIITPIFSIVFGLHIEFSSLSPRYYHYQHFDRLCHLQLPHKRLFYFLHQR